MIARKAFTFLSLCVLFSCEDFVEIDLPQNELVTGNVFEADATALAAINGIFANILDSDSFASGNTGSITQSTGLSSDEFQDFSDAVPNIALFDNSLTPENSLVIGHWNDGFRYIYQANSIIEGLENSTKVTEDLKNQILGEAYFMRAFCNFYLVNLFGGIPIITETDFEENRLLSRSEPEEVYEIIIGDLKLAESLLPTDFGMSNGERTRPISWAAKSLLARTYLYMEEWSLAEQMASEVIENSSLFTLQNGLSEVFLANSPEAIWQLGQGEFAQFGLNTWEGSTFILLGPPTNKTLSQNLINSFEIGDNRLTDWVGSFDFSGTTFHFPFKYKVFFGSPVTEYSMVIRLAELYLIRAESRAHLNNNTGSVSDLNLIRNRAGLDSFSSNSNAEILRAIENERQVELFSEWGHRWLDLKRTNRANDVLGPIKIDWQSTDVLYPIPQIELENAPNLTQNPGY